MEQLRSVLFRQLNKTRSQPWVYFVFFLLAVIMLLQLIDAAIYLVNCPEDGVGWSPSTSEVNWVDTAGPAAGILQPGDFILSWDGIPVNQATHTYAGKRPGDVVFFTVLRNGEVSIESLPLAAPSTATVVNRLEPLLIALIFWTLGIAVFAFNSTDIAARLFYYIFSYAGCGVLVFGVLSTMGLPWASRFFYLSLWLLGPLLVHLHLNFPAPLTIPNRRPVIIVLYVCAGAVALASLVLDLALIRASQSFRAATYFFLIVNLVAVVALLAKSYRRATLPQARREIRIVILGALLAVVPITSLALLPSALFGHPLISYSLAFAFLIAVPLSYGYSIIRYQLIQTDQYVSRRFTNFVMMAILGGFYLLVYEGSRSLSSLRPELAPVVSIVFCLLVVTTFIPVRDKLQKIIDWAFYEGWYDYSSAVQKISHALDQVNEPSTLAVMLTRNLTTIMKLECSCLILLDQGENKYRHMVSCPACPLVRSDEVRTCVTGTISHYLQQEQAPILGSLLQQKLANEPLTPDEQQLLSCAQGRVWVPLLGHDTLLGILILGSKQCDDVFDSMDFEILGVVARQASITIQNTALVVEVQQRASDVERLHQELLRAREDERKRLARELHDEIMQALVGLNYGLSKLDTPHSTLEGNGHVSKLQTQLHQVMDDLRRICKELRPPALDNLGLVSALRSLTREIEAESNLLVELTVSGRKDTKLPEELEVCLFRILQEALTNVQKHAHATHISVGLVIDPAEVRLCVQDDGCGFPIPLKLGQFMNAGHFGLVGVRERLDLVGGKLHLTSTLGLGTYLEARIALPARASDLSARIER